MSKDPKQPQIKSIEVEFVDAKKEDEQDFTFERIQYEPNKEFDFDKMSDYHKATMTTKLFFRPYSLPY